MVQIDKIKSKVLEIGKISPLIHYTKGKSLTSVEINSIKKEDIYELLKTQGQIVLDSSESVLKDTVKIKANKTEYGIKLDKIYSKYKEINNEQGVNSLYIAIGFLDWKDSNEDELYSPLILLPVVMERHLNMLSRSNYTYVLKISDEEIQFNISLIEKLKQEKVKINIPSFDSSVDLSSLFETLQKEFKEFNFKIVENIILGIFYCGRINIYKDIESNTDKIINHPIIKAIDGDQSAIPALMIKDKIDDEFSYLKNFYPVSYDSSQLKAITEASKGKSLVIEGPPGTGKSQTITNIIASAIATGKSVLFVAEKKAALDVVYNNLKRSHLDEFALYIDSNKTNKKTVFNSLYDSLMQKPVLLKEDAYSILSNLDKLKTELDEYSDFVSSKVKNTAYTFYDVFSKYIEVIDYKYVNPFINNIKNKDFGYLHDVISFLDRYNKYLDDLEINYYKDNLYFGYRDENVSLVVKERILTIFNTLLSYDKLDNIIPEKLLKISLNNLYNIYYLSVFKPQYLTKDWFIKGNIDKYISVCSEYFDYDKKINKLEEEITKIFTKDVLDIKVCGSLHIVPEDITDANLKEYKKDIKANLKLLKKYTKEKLTKENVCLYSNLCLNYFKAYGLLSERKEYLLNITLNDQNTDYNDTYKVMTMIQELSLLSNKDYLDIIFSDENYSFKYELINKYIILLNELNSLYDTNITNFKNLTYNELIKKIKLYINQIDSLGLFSALIKDFRTFSNDGLIEFIDEANKLNINRYDLPFIYRKGYYSLLIDDLSSEYKIINSFSQVKEKEEIKDYVVFDELYQLISIVKIKEMISSRKPNPNSQSTKSEIGILKSQKEKPTMPIKTLFNEISRLLLKIKPIMIMSPLAVSTYLPSDIKFDMVIFDEASQIQKEDAICSIYRAKQIVVVGDTEQLPPSDFFKKMVLDDEDEELDDGLAGVSLLDLANTFLENVRLKWHYRSRNEELINFSNHYIYNDYLITFPISREKKESEGLEFYYCEKGIYDRGKTRVNKEEAKMVSDLIIDNIIKYPERSIGVVTFSVAQKNAVSDALNSKLLEIKKEDEKKYNALLTFINDESCKEPFFIKNLESVQGDERDTIIFSICYGKDKEDGELFYNLGRLTRDEGRKRINVAASRSKINMKVVCSFDPDTLVISNSEQTGLLAFKRFLSYAKNKKLDNNINDLNNDIIISEQIAIDIKKCLEEKGLEVDRNIGSSEYKIRLGVKNPQNPSEYILGIILDDNIYSSFKTVRDRDKLWPSVLKKMGWNIYTVYSTDYIKNRKLIIDKLLIEIDNLINNPKINTKDILEGQSYKQFEIEIEHGYIKLNKISETTYDEYMKSNLSYADKFVAIVSKILYNEGPIHKNILARRLLKFYNTDKIDNIVNLINLNIKEYSFTNNIICDGDFYFFDNTVIEFKKTSYTRCIQEIYYVELANLIDRIVSKSIGISMKQIESLLKEYIGYPITYIFTNEEKEIIIKAFDYLIKTNNVKIESDLIFKD